MPRLPRSRGPVSELLLEALVRAPHQLPPAPAPVGDPLSDEDLHLALYCCYELHYRGFDGVPDDWEWEPSLLAFRAGLEDAFETGLRAAIASDTVGVSPEDMDLALRAIAEAGNDRSVSRHVAQDATLEQVLEFMVHRSAYQLKEADPHSWALPRLHGAPKAAIVEVQADEYGGGRAPMIHAELFADAMAAVGLDASYGAYLDRIPGVTLATVNLMSLLGLHRRLLGGIVGHLALFEMTSSIPNRRYADGLRRLGLDSPEVTRFFDEHVLADAVHENIAAVDLAGGLARQRPELTTDILWGARALVLLEDRWTDHLLDRWAHGHSSLLAAETASPARAAA